MKTLILIILSMSLVNCAKNNSEIEIQPDNSSWVETPEEPNFGSSVDTPNPDVLIIGDSISIGYTGPLIKTIGDKYDVRHPADNCRNSYYTLQNIDTWLDQYPHNIIIWNNGIWDTTRADWLDQYMPDAIRSNYGTSLEDYKSNLIQIAQKLKSTSSRVIFLTTTDIPKISGVFEIGKEIDLNSIAYSVLPSMGVEVYDLYSFALSIQDAHTNDFDVHFKTSSNYKFAYFIKDIIGEY